MKKIILAAIATASISLPAQEEKKRPTNLAEAVANAIKTHPSLRAREEANMVADFSIREADGEYYPSVDAIVAGGRENSENSSTINSGNQHNTLSRFESSLVLRQNLYTAGRISNNVEKRRHLAKETFFDILDEKEKVAFNAADTYVAVCQNRALIKIARENVAVHKDILKTVNFRLERGQSRKADVIQVKGRLAQAQAQLQRELANREALKEQFFEAVGSLPNENFSEPKSLTSFLPETLMKAKETAQAQHPALAARIENISASKSALKESKSRYYPQWSFEIRLNENENIGGIEETDDSYSAMVRMDWNLFNGGSDKAEQNRIRHERSQSELLYNDETGKIKRNVATAWYDYQGILIELDYFLQYEQAATETSKAYKEQYRLNQRTLFDLLNAQNELFIASSRVIESSYAKQSALFSLLINMGSISEPILVAK